eukprot:gene20243-22225_t
MDEVCACWTDPIHFDMDVYSLWLQGINEEEATRQRRHTDPSINTAISIALTDTRQQYQLFQLLEKFFSSPQSLKRQMLCILPTSVQQTLIERYYSFDKEVIREFLGKKMSAKLRKDMDDVSEKTGIPLKRCRRQFDNVKNVLKAYEDSEGCAHEVINRNFLFSQQQARMYALLVFLFVNRFDSSKKRLAYLTFDDFMFCAEQMLSHWCVGSFDASYTSSDVTHDDDEIDRNFFQEVRDLKNIITDKDSNDQLKRFVVAYLENNNFIGLAKSTESVFRNITTKLFQIGSSMTNTRDVREFFSHTVEKVIEPVRQMEWTKHEFETFLEALIKLPEDHVNLLTFPDPNEILSLTDFLFSTKSLQKRTETEDISKLIKMIFIAAYIILQLGFMTVSSSPMCPKGVPVFNCFKDPCMGKECPRYPEARCVQNYCGGCGYDFFHKGKKVDCKLEAKKRKRPCPMMACGPGYRFANCKTIDSCLFCSCKKICESMPVPCPRDCDVIFEDGCPSRCRCRSRPLPPCPLATCMMHCEDGFQVDQNGCQICRCKGSVPMEIKPQEPGAPGTK